MKRILREDFDTLAEHFGLKSGCGRSSGIYEAIWSSDLQKGSYPEQRIVKLQFHLLRDNSGVWSWLCFSPDDEILTSVELVKPSYDVGWRNDPRIKKEEDLPEPLRQLLEFMKSM